MAALPIFGPPSLDLKLFNAQMGKRSCCDAIDFVCGFPPVCTTLEQNRSLSLRYFRDKTNATREIRWRPVGCLLSRHSYRLRDASGHMSHKGSRIKMRARA